MKLCGWKTLAMFDRYNLIDEQDLAQAVAKRFCGKSQAKTGGIPDKAQSVNFCRAEQPDPVAQLAEQRTFNP